VLISPLPPPSIYSLRPWLTYARVKMSRMLSRDPIYKVYHFYRVISQR